MVKKLAKKEMPLFNLILLGDVAAGKGTQAQYLVKKYEMYDFDMGEELSRARKRDPKVDSICRQVTDQGKLAPTSIVRKIFVDGLANIPLNRGIIFDGTPKMVGEAKLVRSILAKQKRALPLVLYLTIPHSETVHRIRSRRGYKETEAKRPDDNLKALANRDKYYRTNIKEVVEFFALHYTFARISGLGTRQEVRSRINKAVNFYLKNYEQINKKT